ncbi:MULTISPECIES: SDR family oxidoreductase [unclassified Cryobacterium]|uniref:SDR family oxidoreductase n=1 Tax=unclassified Cryobacterium TaxID=2649013 RepID=UPI002AB48545|nr:MULTISPECIES: SDR family oxidoreductase [unclassified Cryobacterium]MDY7543371.1 SDR family oxidoreductase [Cryobacterium sp. 5B3]MEA9999690.1 SDR family oxidoreductase [Cryobacterium sp. RTS3]MEB0264984.1 SDR family oxidoreductase [Cryobacterium sp. 10I5]MEB0274693.1 SDR family oxidoreductase [Cryobacterium sp. 5B3]
MTPPVRIATTGATGVVGGLVARDLADRGATQRLLVRTPAKAPQLPNSTVHQSNYSDQAASTAALAGVDVLFMVSASESAKRVDEHRSFIDAAAAAGVGHIVYTSFAAAAPDATFTLARDHYATEEYIKASGMNWTFLRDGLYLDFMEALVGDDGVIRGPAGDGRSSFVSRADVARTGVAVLVDPAPHAAHTYDITGPEALSLTEVAATISRIRGENITFLDESIEEAYRSRARYGAPDWQVDAWVSTYTAIASGVMAPVSDSVEQITGIAPMNLETYLTTHPR